MLRCAGLKAPDGWVRWRDTQASQCLCARPHRNPRRDAQRHRHAPAQRDRRYRPTTYLRQSVRQSWSTSWLRHSGGVGRVLLERLQEPEGARREAQHFRTVNRLRDNVGFRRDTFQSRASMASSGPGHIRPSKSCIHAVNRRRLLDRSADIENAFFVYSYDASTRLAVSQPHKAPSITTTVGAQA